MKKRAIVMGYSMAGKLAARVLSEAFEEVVVLEKDSEPLQPEPRKGVPQSHQPHVLLRKGAELLEGFFPGLEAELLQLGAVQFNFYEDVYWVHHGLPKLQVKDTFNQLSQSRPLLEWVIQKRLDQRENVDVRYNKKVQDLLMSDKNERVTGVCFQDGLTREVEALEADLVVDTTGAATFTYQLFKNKGLPTPMEETIEVGLTYTSQKMKLPFYKEKQTLIIYPHPPEIERGGILYPLENGEWMVTLIGYGGEAAPFDHDGFLAYAESLSDSRLYHVLKKGEPQSEPKRYRFPKMSRRNGLSSNSLPENLIVMGDGLCRFDPVFGQGMTAAAMEAEELQHLLQKSQRIIGTRPFLKVLYKKFNKRLSPLWLMVTAEDFMYTHTKGRRLIGLSLLQTYMKKMYAASEYDATVYQQFARILHLLDSPFRLFHPKIIFKVLLEKKNRSH